jgi:hypothetical protein
MRQLAVALDALNSELDPPLVHDPGFELVDESGVGYRVLVAGRYESAGSWGGWIEYYPSNPELDPLRTDRETTQPNYSSLVEWARGLGKPYLEGAFARAHPWQ